MDIGQKAPGSGFRLDLHYCINGGSMPFFFQKVERHRVETANRLCFTPTLL